ncbi:hypothetical protein GCM10023336_30660 [Streptomyces similanensis]|uniref:Uncharacterized protein n=1 Tax=Streptomyces similanensis TaxID=1274988 RepID=A0ABP9KHR1_9ACTN
MYGPPPGALQEPARENPDGCPAGRKAAAPAGHRGPARDYLSPAAAHAVLYDAVQISEVL